MTQSFPSPIPCDAAPLNHDSSQANVDMITLLMDSDNTAQFGILVVRAGTFDVVKMNGMLRQMLRSPPSHRGSCLHEPDGAPRSRWPKEEGGDDQTPPGESGRPSPTVRTSAPPSPRSRKSSLRGGERHPEKIHTICNLLDLLPGSLHMAHVGYTGRVVRPPLSPLLPQHTHSCTEFLCPSPSPG